MNKNIKYIIALVMLIVFPMTMLGFTVYHHICLKSGAKQTALFTEAKCAHEESENCCEVAVEVEEHSCCSESPANATLNDVSLSHNDCCTSFQDYHVINESFKTNDNEKNKILLPLISYIYSAGGLLNDNKISLAGIRNAISLNYKLPTKAILRFISFMSLAKISESDSF
jgi:hypothetical protein